jgi:hypothetical protein
MGLLGSKLPGAGREIYKGHVRLLPATLWKPRGAKNVSQVFVICKDVQAVQKKNKLLARCIKNLNC